MFDDNHLIVKSGTYGLLYLALYFNDLYNIISFLLFFDSTLLKSDGNDILPFLSTLFKNLDTNKFTLIPLFSYTIGLTWDYMGVNGLKRIYLQCSYNVHGKDGA